MSELVQVGQELIQFLVRLEDISAQFVHRGDRPHALAARLLVKLGGIRAAPGDDGRRGGFWFGRGRTELGGIGAGVGVAVRGSAA
jgi:hypothetical protein